MALQASFTHLTEEELKTLYQSVESQPFGAGEVIVREGALQGTMYVITRGKVRIERLAADGPAPDVPVVMAHLGLGMVFGEMSFLDRAPASATVVAETDVEVKGIGRAEIDRISSADGTFTSRFYHCLALTLVDKLRATTRRLA